MAKIFRKTHNPYALCAITHSLTLISHEIPVVLLSVKQSVIALVNSVSNERIIQQF